MYKKGMDIVFSAGYFLVVFDNQELRLPTPEEVPKVNTERVSDGVGPYSLHVVNTEISECVPKNFDNIVTFWAAYDEVTRIGTIMQYPFTQDTIAAITACYSEPFLKEMFKKNPEYHRRVFYNATSALTRTLLLGPQRSFDVPFKDGDDYYSFYDYGDAIRRNTTQIENDLPGIYRVAVMIDEFTEVDMKRFSTEDRYKVIAYEMLNRNGCIICDDAIICISNEYFTVLDGMIEEPTEIIHQI
jgi:hypothetical protein